MDRSEGVHCKRSHQADGNQSKELRTSDMPASITKTKTSTLGAHWKHTETTKADKRAALERDQEKKNIQLRQE